MMLGMFWLTLQNFIYSITPGRKFCLLLCKFHISYMRNKILKQTLAGQWQQQHVIPEIHHHLVDSKSWKVAIANMKTILLANSGYLTVEVGLRALGKNVT